MRKIIIMVSVFSVIMIIGIVFVKNRNSKISEENHSFGETQENQEEVNSDNTFPKSTIAPKRIENTDDSSKKDNDETTQTTFSDSSDIALSKQTVEGEQQTENTSFSDTNTTTTIGSADDYDKKISETEDQESKITTHQTTTILTKRNQSSSSNKETTTMKVTAEKKVTTMIVTTEKKTTTAYIEEPIDENPAHTKPTTITNVPATELKHTDTDEFELPEDQ